MTTPAAYLRKSKDAVTKADHLETLMTSVREHGHNGDTIVYDDWVAVRQIGTAIQERADDGSDIAGEMTFLTRPRSYLVVGHLSQLVGEGGGPHREKVRSFELYRRSLRDPEIVTFDELLARAEWVVEVEGDD